MLKRLLPTAALLAAASIPNIAYCQSVSQEDLDTRYERALAAGYKALMVCGAVKNAEALRSGRSLESVEANELVGIYPSLDPLIPTLEAKIGKAGVSVAWDDEMPPRIAVSGAEAGCSLLPIGATSGQAPNFAVTTFEGHPPETRSWPAGNAVTPVGGPTALRATIADAFATGYGEGTNTTAVVVLRGGRLVEEAYKEGFGPLVPQRTWSVAKSIAATLVGAAVQRGDLAVADSAGLGLSEDDPRRAITIDHLLRMASGRYSDTPGNRTDPLYFGGATVGELAAAWPLLAQPGRVFRYANNDSLMAVAALRESIAEHPPRSLFQRLGMYSTIAETDWRGNYILSSQVWSTARDLAKLGQLYLDDGVRDGEQILPAGWADYVSSASGPQPQGPFGYGAGFWLFNETPGVPPDSFAAMGNRGQYVVVVPARDIVVVRRGEDPAGSRFDIAQFTADVLENMNN